MEVAQQVRAMLDADLQETVPKMCLLGPINGLVGVAENALPGQPLEIAATNNRRNTALASNCRAFAQWLIRFQTCTQGCVTQIDRGVLESLLMHVLERSPGANDTHEWVTDEIADKLLGQQMPLVWAYGDAHPSNILIKDGLVSGVVDWEGAEPGQWAVFDWFQFTLSLAQELLKAKDPSMDRLQRAVTACELLIRHPNTREAMILQEQTASFLSMLNLCPGLTRALFLVFLIAYYWFEDKEALVHSLLDQL
ncbi:MAG: phosphotransferase [bacterium]